MIPQYLNKKFASLKELHHFLKDNNEQIISEKKSTVFKSIEKGAGVSFVDFDNNTEAVTEKARGYGFKTENIYPVINSTQWLDSHFDVHIKGCYKKTVKEKQGKVYLIDTHLKGLGNILADKSDITLLIKDIDWGLLGKNIEGSTECLVFEIPKLKVRPDALQFMSKTPDLENSFAMRYINTAVAIKSNDPAFREENELFDEYIQNIVNPEMANKYGFFYAVKELAIMGEGSICPVIGGSNSATRIIDISEPSNHSESNKNEPSKDTQPSKKITFVKLKSN